MHIIQGNSSDASLIHDLMIQAYQEYENKNPSSSALEETVSSVRTSLETNELSFIAYDNDVPVGMVRFQITNQQLYFYRLSVIPKQQGKGIAKKLLQRLEDYAKENNLSTIACRVRKAMPRNIHLYQSLSYEIIHEESITLPNGQIMELYLMEKQITATAK